MNTTVGPEQPETSANNYISGILKLNSAKFAVSERLAILFEAEL